MVPKWIGKKLRLRSIIKYLEAEPRVVKIKTHSWYTEILFDTGIKECWVHEKSKYSKISHKNKYKLPISTVKLKKIDVPTYRQFEINKHLYPEEYQCLKNHFIIKKKDLKKAGWINKRLKFHDLTVELAEEGYIPLEYTDSMLKKDWDDLINDKCDNYKSSKIRVSSFSNVAPKGKRLIMNFMPCAAAYNWHNFPIYYAINQCRRKDLTRENIVFALSNKFEESHHPAFYQVLFDNYINIDGKPVLDVNPGWGFKSLAVMSRGGHYYCQDDKYYCYQYMADFIRGKVSNEILDKYYLIMISDSKPTPIKDVDKLIKKFSKIGEYLLITVLINNASEWKELIDKYKPINILRNNTNPTFSSIDDNLTMIIKT